MSRPRVKTERAEEPRGVGRPGLVAAALAFVVYIPSIAGPFLYDDVRTIVDNPTRGGGTLADVLLYDRARPVLNLSWRLNAILSGAEPWSYHLLNVVIHAANAALCASLFLWIARRAGVRRPEWTAFLGAVLFAVSPMAAESVAYVSSRSSTLAALFALASLRVGVELLERSSAMRLVAALGLLGLGLATKEEALAAPLLLLLLDFFFVADQRPRALARRWIVHACYVGLPLFGIVARRALTGTWLPAGEMPRVRYLLLEWAAFPLYLARVLLPFDPALYRGHAVWPPSAGTYVLGAVGTAVVAAAIAGRRRWALGTFAVLWLGIALLPSSSLVPLGEPIADHRAYLGGAAGLLAVASLLAIVRRPERLTAAVVVLLAAVAVRYEWVLMDPVRVWTDATARAPTSALAWRSLAEAYLARGQREEAEASFVAAVRVATADAESWTNLAVFYGKVGRLPDAEHALRQAAAVASPAERGQVYDNLGIILLRQGREDEAIPALEHAIAAQPTRVQPYLSLAQILIRRGDRGRAGALLETATQAPEVTHEEAEWIERLRRQT